MIKLAKLPVLLLCGAAMVFGFSSCSDDNGGNDSSEKQQQMSGVLNQYINGTVYPTYAKLAEESRQPLRQTQSSQN